MRLILFFALTACGGSSTNPVTTAGAAPNSSKPIVTWKTGTLTLQDVEAKVQDRLDAMERDYKLERYQLLSQALDSAIDDALLKEEATKRGLSDPRELLKLEIEDKVSPPTEEELKAFYEDVKGQLRGAAYEDVAGMLAGELIQRQMGGAYEVFVADLRHAADVHTNLRYPDLKRTEIALSDTDPVNGDADAPVTIVQFAEYQCYFCNKVSPTLDALLNDYKGKIKLVYKDFPLDSHPRAMPAAVAARCAGDQGKYWEMNHILLANQSKLEDPNLAQYARDLKLDEEAFQTCLADDAHRAQVQAAFAQGQAAGVQATPTFYINGLLVSGAQPYDVFKAVIEQELEH